MKFGFCLPNYGGKIRPEEMIESAILAESTGFDSVWATDHIIVPRKFAQPYGDLVEPLVTLSYIAAKTDSVRLGSSIIVVPQRNPILVAKQVASLDRLSRGRVILGTGVGWMEEEFRFLNADFKSRGKFFDESIQLMRALWKDEFVTFSSGSFKLRDAVFLPKPKNQIPIWIGGGSMTAIRRASRLGDGWHPVGLAPLQVERGVKMIRRRGRKVTISLRITTDLKGGRSSYRAASGEEQVGLAGSRQDIVRTIEVYESAGVEYFVVFLNSPNSDQLFEDMKKFSSDILRSFK
jgi:probable F420-dependent oxidoreductase